MLRTAILSWSVSLLVVSSLAAQVQDSSPGEFSKALTLLQDPRVVGNLEILPLYTLGDGWPTAIEILQDLVDSPHDSFVPALRKRPDGTTTTLWVGARSEGLRLLAELPKEGRDVYETLSNVRAREALAQARKTADWRRVAEVAQRFPFTPAGVESAKLLGLFCLDRGDVDDAGRWFQLWMQRQSAWREDGASVFAAWLAFRQCGPRERADELWQVLQSKHSGGIVVADRKVPLADLKKQFNLAGKEVGTAAAGWWLFGGNPTRTAAAGKLPTLDVLRWSVSAAEGSPARALLDRAINTQEARPQPVLCGSFPIAVGGRVLFRGTGGIHAVSSQTGKELWKAPLALGLDQLLADQEFKANVDAWVDGYLKYHPHAVFDDSNVGCLSSDGMHVFVVEDLPVLPFVGRYAFARPPHSPEISVATKRSRLRALDLQTGKPVWEIGAETPAGKAPSFVDDCLFLGAPLPIRNKLYGAAESAGVLHLYWLDRATGTLLGKQPLAALQNKLPQDGGRRLQALHLSHDQGVLVCPTNGGAVIAYDLVRGCLLWAHAYRTQPLAHGPRLRGLRPAQEIEIESIPNLRSPWQVTAPRIAGGKVFHAAADSPVLECLNLHDGAVVWKAERTPDDLYFAGLSGVGEEGVALVVGRSHCRGLRAADGKELWKIATGTPSGQGCFMDGRYYLPVKSAAGANKPGILPLDPVKGIAGTLMVLPGKEIPGNLLVAGDTLVAQSPTAVVAWGAQGMNE